MIHLRGEGQLVRNGFNVYPPKEWNYSRGFIFRLGNYKLSIRYSVKLKKLLVHFSKKGT